MLDLLNPLLLGPVYTRESEGIADGLAEGIALRVLVTDRSIAADPTFLELPFELTLEELE